MITAKRPLLALTAALLLGGCATPEMVRTPSTAVAHDVARSTYLGSWTRQATQHHDELSGLRLLTQGREAFALRAALAANAQKSLDVQTYILEEDSTSHALLHQLLLAAQRGVRVRLLLDDTASLGKQPLLAALDSHPNVEVRVFNPVPVGRGNWLAYYLALASDFDHRHRRMHNKLWLTDGSVAITGGRNLGDEYFDVAEEINFDDLDVLAVGPVVDALSGSFDAYWNHRLAVPLRQFTQAASDAWLGLLAELGAEVRQDDALPAPEAASLLAGTTGQALRESLTWAPAVALWDLPEKLESEDYPPLGLTLLAQLSGAFANLRQRLLIISPYVIPTRAGIRYLQSLEARGIEVTILTNSLEATDLPALHGAYAPWRPELLANGARLHELRANPAAGASRGRHDISSLHTKAMAFDDERVFIGSLNTDPRSVWWNSEVGLLIDSPTLARQLWALAARGADPRHGYEVRLTQDGHLAWLTEMDGHQAMLREEPGGFWRRLKAWGLRLLPIEHLL
ncbi:phospholipase D-like domain-containing protein [Halomonas shantousis]